MDAKITLSFNEEVIKLAKNYARRNRMSLSRLTEFIYSQLASETYTHLEDLPIDDWVNMVAEGPAEYGIKRKKNLKKGFHERS